MEAKPSTCMFVYFLNVVMIRNNDIPHQPSTSIATIKAGRYQNRLISDVKGKHLAKRLHDMSLQQLIPSSLSTIRVTRPDSLLNTNIANMKTFIEAKSKVQTKRDYAGLKEDLLLHRRNSLLSTDTRRVSKPDDNEAFRLDDNSQHKYIKNYTNDLYMVADNEEGGFLLNGNSQHKYTKDYISLAKDYKRMESYRCNNPITMIDCVLCANTVQKVKIGSKKNAAMKVFFPCEHLCLCNSCYNKETWDTCPLCHENIKVIFDHDGKEVEAYWRWVNEIVPPISSSFKRAFPRLSREAIAVAMARSIDGIDLQESDISKSKEMDNTYPDGMVNGNAVQSSACTIS